MPVMLGFWAPTWVALLRCLSELFGIFRHGCTNLEPLFLHLSPQATPSSTSRNMPRASPNIVITGTPGVGMTIRSKYTAPVVNHLHRTGKSSHCELLAESTGLRHLSVNQIVKDKSCHEGYDDELKTWIVDEDKLLDEIEPQLEEGGNIIDWHVCEVFPERLIDLVVVLRVDSQLLYDRLKARY